MHLKSEFTLSVLVAIGAAGLLGWVISQALPVAGSGDIDARELPSGWSETIWPFERDQFAAGAAFECRAPACDGRIRVTVRPKIGFCDCVAGVADDDMLDQIGDVALNGAGFVPGQAGREIVIGAMKGRSRRYASAALSTSVLSVAFSKRCDVVVASATGVETPEAAARAMALLESAAIVNWAGRILGR